jgi:hypothetical protein
LGASKRQIYRVEKRLKAPGKINRLIKKLEKLDRIASTLNKAEMRNQLESVRHDLDMLEKEMASDEIEALKISLEFKNLPPLRDLPPRQQRREMPKVALRERDTQSEMFVTKTALISPGGHFPPQETKQLTYHRTFFVPPV